MTSRHPPHCIVPPYLLERLARSEDARIRQLAVDAIANAAEVRATRRTLATMPAWAALPSPERRKHRLVYDARQGGVQDLPGTLMREEGDRRTRDPAVNEAYDHSGATYDFYRRLFGRNSLDGRGMSLVSSVHLGRKLNNAFWTGEQMCYGDGDGQVFVRFTRALEVVGHELSHGVVTHTCNLEYRDEPGALNEHFADVFGILVRQWRRRQEVRRAGWLIGAEILGPATTARALRTFEEGKAYEDDPLLGTDPQPKHLRDRYTGRADDGGVHINSGIPNHAFHRAALELGGRAWERAGAIWYRTMLKLTSTSGFAEMVKASVETAITEHGAGSREHRAVESAWKAVGF
jgi:Zn-dependent metalloprotease